MLKIMQILVGGKPLHYTKIFIQVGRMKRNNVNNANKTMKGATICLEIQIIMLSRVGPKHTLQWIFHIVNYQVRKSHRQKGKADVSQDTTKGLY